MNLTLVSFQFFSIYFWLHWVSDTVLKLFMAARRLSLVWGHHYYQLLTVEHGLSNCGPWA